MRITIRIEMTEEDLPMADLIDVILGDSQEAVADDSMIDDIQIVYEEHPPQTYFDGQHGCEEELEEELVQEVVEMQETATEPAEKTIEEEVREEEEPVRKEPESVPANNEYRPSLAIRGKKRKGRQRRQARPSRPLREPMLKDIGLSNQSMELLLENKVASVGDFVNTAVEELQFFTQINSLTRIEQYQRKARALIRKHEHDLTMRAKRIEASKMQQETPEIEKKWTVEMNSMSNLLSKVWAAMPDRKAGAYNSLDISRDTYNSITNKYDVTNVDVDGEALYGAAQMILQAIYDTSTTPDFILGRDGRDAGSLLLVVLTNAKWPSRSSLQLEA